MIDVLYPRIPLTRLPTMFSITLLGAVLAGCYGALHDQLSYSISPEYFTKMKFIQFSYADFGWPQRVFASEVGFLASWWVGTIGGWILARLGLESIPKSQRRSHVAIAFAIVFVSAILIGGAGLLIGTIIAHRTDLSGWNKYQDLLELKDLPSFVIVAWLHAASYLGALMGVIAAGVYVRRTVNRLSTASLR